MTRAFAACATALTFGVIIAGTAAAQEFYSGKQIRIIFSSASGGGYDQYARMLQRHMPKHILGQPSILVVNMLSNPTVAAESPVE